MTSLAPPDASRAPALVAFALLVLTYFAYSPAFGAGYIWDDDAHVTNNAALRTTDGLARIWVEPGAVQQYYPLVYTSFWVEYQLWGLDPRGYHAVNVILHVTTAILLAALLQTLGIPGAWLVAALFALHPVHVESVAWVSERKNVLSGTLYVLAFLLYWKCRDNGRGTRWLAYFGASLAFTLALLSKTVTCSLPAAILLLLWWRDGRLTRHDLLRLAPWFVIGAALAANTAWVERYYIGTHGDQWQLTLAERLLIAGRAVWFYVAKLAWPTRLTFVYPRFEIDAGNPLEWIFPIAACTLVAVLWLARHRIGRGPLTAALFFGGTLIPALGLFDVYPMRYTFVADHYQYLASLGPLTLAGAAGASAMRRSPLVGSVACTLVLTLLAHATWRQTHIYRNPETLWRDTLAKNDRCWMAMLNLGSWSAEQKRPQDAIRLYQQSLAVEPDIIEAHMNLAQAWADVGRHEDAIAAYRRARRLDPTVPDPYVGSAKSLAAVGRSAEAVRAFRAAIRLHPQSVTPRLLLAQELRQSGAHDEARRELNGARLAARQANRVDLEAAIQRRWDELTEHTGADSAPP